MRKILLAPIVVFFAVSPLACSGDDELPSGLPTGDPDLIAMVDCVEEAISHIGLVVETGVHLFHELDTGEVEPYTPPPEFGYDESSGEVYNSATLGGVVTFLDGLVEPLAVVSDGLQQDDIFNFTWWLQPAGSLDNVAGGAFVVVHFGLTLPPNPTETMRITPAADIWVDTGGTCHTDFGQFQIFVHHLLSDSELASGFVSFTTISDTQTATGLLTVGETPNTASLNVTFKGTTYDCTVDLETYAVSCSLT